MKPPIGVHEQERESISEILENIKAHSNTLETFREDHSGQAASIEERARDTFQNQYAVSCFFSQLVIMMMRINELITHDYLHEVNILCA